MGYPFSEGKFVLGIIFALWRMCSAKEISTNFVFGDSLVEVGNNNYIVTLSKADHPPYGIDFGKPTGRFTNGRTIIDIAGQTLGLKEFTPPYLAPTTAGPVILRGVNYASGGGGILNETGKLFIGRINLDAQIDNFANTREDIISSIGRPAAVELLRRALFSRLYNLGARKMVVVGVGPLGCIPYQRDINIVANPDSCVQLTNQLARSFNSKLQTLVTELNTNLTGAKFVYANVYGIFHDIIENYKSYGFENANSACCGFGGRYGGLGSCGSQPLEVCEDRSKYVFWDAYHPSEACNMIIARRLLYGNSSDISPMNIVQLLQSS
ncbi:GDSL esterase/lipase At4g16230-like isoform X2 [Rosa rugosa]|uniref:GDSL esterase/lipase At4g16230-like isoform X2 n=1 Tax=Rosa rugosa TaxID=74645 RepID=UPI002B40A0D6|nr:GDSL esterase/lipase At4g16230-like isoform X2 [Rosa rugosa]